MPPVSVITTSKTPNHEASESVETPVVLIKPPKKEKLPEINRTISVPSRPLDYAPTGSIAVVDRGSNDLLSHSLSELSPEESDRHIDSALLSALQDSRERLALLRLEKNLVDFMNDRTCGYMEVGGPGNSIVIRGASGGNGSSSCTENDGDNAPVKKISGSGEIFNGGRQTSFQRLCLHRLADRFNIAREQVFYQNPIMYTNMNMGLIRLVKVKESRIPTLMLIDVDMSQYDRVTPQDRTDGLSVMKITEQLSGTSLQEGSTGIVVKKSKKKENIKIMKRSSSSALTTGSEKSAKSKASKRKSKNLSDKEKAYAEARARIFNSADSSVNNTPDASEHADNGSTDGTPPGSANRSRAASPVQIKSESTGSCKVVDETSSKPTKAGNVVTNNEKIASKRSILPVAVTTGAASKVTWRNREQEASDPDFRRGHHNIMMQVPPMQINYQGYASHTGMGYHYGPVVDGQQPYGYSPTYPPYYGTPAIPMYHVDSSSQRQSYPPNSQLPSVQDHGHINDSGNIMTSKSQNIDFSTEEFPALR